MIPRIFHIFPEPEFNYSQIFNLIHVRNECANIIWSRPLRYDKCQNAKIVTHRLDLSIQRFHWKLLLFFFASIYECEIQMRRRRLIHVKNGVYTVQCVWLKVWYTKYTAQNDELYGLNSSRNEENTKNMLRQTHKTTGHNPLFGHRNGRSVTRALIFTFVYVEMVSFGYDYKRWANSI